MMLRWRLFRGFFNASSCLGEENEKEYQEYALKQVFRRGYRPRTINFPYNWSRIRKLQHLSLILGLSGNTQIRTLLRALHVYSNQSALRILRHVMSSIF